MAFIQISVHRPIFLLVPTTVSYVSECLLPSRGDKTKLCHCVKDLLSSCAH